MTMNLSSTKPYGIQAQCFIDSVGFGGLKKAVQGKTTQLAVYTTYLPLIYCQLGDYMWPTTY